MTQDMKPDLFEEQLAKVNGTGMLLHGIEKLHHRLRDEVSVPWSDTHDCHLDHNLTPLMDTFSTGATRNSDHDKIDFEGFIDPLVLDEYGKYMHEHRKQADGKLRDSDNWQKGIPFPRLMKSLLRHTHDLWCIHRGHVRYCPEDKHELTAIEVCCAIMFNVMCYVSQQIKKNAE